MPELNIDLTEYVESDESQSSGFKLLEKGWYRFEIDESTYKESNRGYGMILGLTLLCLDGKYQGRKLWENLQVKLLHDHIDAAIDAGTLTQKEEDGLEYSKQLSLVRLKEIATAAGHPTPDQIDRSEELHNKPFWLRVWSQKADEGYGDENGMENVIAEYSNKAPKQTEPALERPAFRDVLSADDVPF